MKPIKYIIIVILVALIGYNSIEIKPLDEVQKEEVTFDAAAYARNFLNQTLPEAYNDAIDLASLKELLAKDSDAVFDRYSHAVSIGNVRHFLVRGLGNVKSINEDEVILQLENDSSLRLATEYIYGSSIRDASGQFDIKEFTNNTDMNNVAAEINKIIRTEVVPAFKANLKEGDPVEFIGAIELNRAHPRIMDLEVLPIQLK